MKLSLLYINALPRSGSTLLMKMLSSFSNVAFIDEYPYEQRICSYLASAFFVMTSKTTKIDPSPWFDSLSDEGLVQIFPFQSIDETKDWYFGIYKENLRKALRNSLECFALNIVEKKGCFEDTIWWAEKFPHNYEESIFELFGNMSLVTLIRNPLDITKSRYRLYKSNHSLWDSNETDSNIRFTLNNSVKQMYDLLKATDDFNKRHSTECLVLRYEQITCDKLDTLNILQEKYQLKTCYGQPSDVLKSFNKLEELHRSSKSKGLSESFELDDNQLIKLLSKDSLEYMRLLGYEF